MTETTPRRLTYVRLDEVQHAPRNPKGHADGIGSSIAHHGFVEVPARDARTGRLVAGHGRHEQLVQMHADGQSPPDGVLVDADGMWLMPLLDGWASRSDGDAETYLIGSNRWTELGGWETGLLAMLSELDETHRELAGYDGDTFDQMLEEADRLGNENPFDYRGEAGDGDDDDLPSSGSVYTDDEIIDEAFTALRAAGFPYPVMPKYDAMQQINRLAATDTDKLMGTVTAYHVADPYQPHRFSCPIPGKYLPTDSFMHDKRLRHALTLALQAGRITPQSLLSALGFVRNTQLAAQFRPGFALLMYRRFAPAGGTVLDTSTGYGGRLTGFIASHCSTYIGIDPEPRTSAGNRQLAADLCPPDKTIELHELPAEDVPHELVAGRADFAFTSPPYFGKEQYGDGDTQSWVRYPGGEAWRDGFLQPTLALQYAALKPGSVAAVNIADVKIDGTSYPLADWTIEAGRAVGFNYRETERFPISRAPGRGEAQAAYEPVIIFERP